MNSIQGRREALAREARYFHALFFPGQIPSEVVDRYVAANELCLGELAESSARLLERVVGANLDAEAIELVLRLEKRDSVLTKKIQILFYLLEVRSQYYPWFVNQRCSFLQAAGTLLFSALRTAVQFVKGKYLIWKYHLV
jgi:hypothetical protein